MPALIAMLFAAVSVSVRVDAQTIGSTTVILPAPVPAALVVVTTTFAPASAVVKVPVVSNESCIAPDAVNGFPLALALVSVPVIPAVVALP